MTTQPTAITKILHWQDKHQGEVEYSETASTRLDYETPDDLVTPTDCSGMAAKMFRHFAGIDIGTYTGNECAYGELVTESKSAARMGTGMLPGDCILFDWDRPGGNGYADWDHIAIYAGNGRIWNHGGPGKGPLNWSLADNVDNASHVMVRRFLPWPADPAHNEAQEDDMPKWMDEFKNKDDFAQAIAQAVLDAPIEAKDGTKTTAGQALAQAYEHARDADHQTQPAPTAPAKDHK
ncbi:MAG TPA: NlpC/P60 family protein [Frankiaceae bacterium]|jgi:hypothetical protein|nr:NlpC/P60 family protein [Frankiaceae bacterium]